MGLLQLALLAAFLAVLAARPVGARDLLASGSGADIARPPLKPVQLSEAVTPRHYRLDMTIDPAQERFVGHVEIEVELTEAAASVDLHGRDFIMRRATARIGGRDIQGRWSQTSDAGDARLAFAEALPVGRVTLLFDYEGSFNSSPAGLFRVKVGDDWYSWSQFQSTDARAAFPAFDEPRFKTPFDVTLRTPEGMMAVSNAPEIETRTENGWTIHTFATTLPLPTYLVAMMAGPFVSRETVVPPNAFRDHGLPVRVLSTRPNAGKLDYALQGSQEILPLLENFFGEAFPYPKLDQITSPVMSGAMENAGADLYGDGILVLDDGASTSQRRKFGMVVAHELGHQWFGDLVTPAWWDDIWLNESFANWIGYRIGDAWKPDLNIRGGLLSEGFRAMKIDALVAGRPIRQPIIASEEIDSAFDAITYGKGGHVVGMIAAFTGPERFRAGVRRYMSDFRHGSATSQDFYGALAEAAQDGRLVSAMKSFVEQQGVPLLTFQRKGKHYTVTQHRFSLLASQVPETHWHIPFCVREGARKTCRILTEKSDSIVVQGHAVLVPNADGAGYYRFELTKRHWNSLIANARSLTGGEAQALADSLYASVLAGRGNVGELARLARKLVKHPDGYAADAAADAMAELASSGVVDASGRSGWRRFRQRLYKPELDRLGFDPGAGAYSKEPPERLHRRIQAVSRMAGAPRAGALRRTLSKATASYLNGDDKALDQAWFPVAFELHVASNGESAARDLLARALASEDPVFRPAAMNAATSSDSVTLANRLLDEMDDERLRENEKQALLEGIMAREATRDIGYRWIRDNLDKLLSGDSGIAYNSKLPGYLEGYCSVSQADQFALELKSKFAGTSGQLALERTLEKVRNCGKLKMELGAQLSSEFANLN